MLHGTRDTAPLGTSTILLACCLAALASCSAVGLGLLRLATLELPVGFRVHLAGF